MKKGFFSLTMIMVLSLVLYSNSTLGRQDRTVPPTYVWQVDEVEESPEFIDLSAEEQQQQLLPVIVDISDHLNEIAQTNFDLQPVISLMQQEGAFDEFMNLWDEESEVTHGWATHPDYFFED